MERRVLICCRQEIKHEVRFISDIASFELKPLFLVGAAITATGFVVTVAAVHVVRYEPGFALARPCGRHPGLNHTDENRRNSDDGCRSDEAQDAAENEDEDHNVTVTLRLMSLLSILAAAVAGSALVLLAVMDTFRYHRAHSLLALIVCSFVSVLRAWLFRPLGQRWSMPTRLWVS